MSHLHVADCGKGLVASWNGTVFLWFVLVPRGHVHFLPAICREPLVTDFTFVRSLLQVTTLVRLKLLLDVVLEQVCVCGGGGVDLICLPSSCHPASI